jgi:hypothetical protein
MVKVEFQSGWQVAEERVWEFVGSGKVDEWVKTIITTNNQELKSNLKARLMMLKLFGWDIEKRLRAKLRNGTF